MARNVQRLVTTFTFPALTPRARKVVSVLRARYYMVSSVSTRPSAFVIMAVAVTGQDRRLKWIVILGMFTKVT